MTTYQRKTKDVWELQVNYGYGGGWETECEEDTRAEAIAQLRTYRANVSYPVRIRKRRIRLVPFVHPIVEVEVYGLRGPIFLRIYRGQGFNHSVSVAHFVGTAAAICGGMEWENWPSQTGWGVLLDRLQEAPEEVEGLSSADVVEAVEWLRAHRPPV